MTDIADLPEAKAASTDDLPPFLDGPQKDELIAEQHGFLITGVKPHVPTTNPMFKDQIHYIVAFMGDSAVAYMETQKDEKTGAPFAKDGKVRTSTGEYVVPTRPSWADNAPRWTLAITWNKARGPQAEGVLAKFEAGNNMVGPCWLSEIENSTPGFNPTRVLIGHPQDPPKKKQRQPVAAAASTTSDDGLPF